MGKQATAVLVDKTIDNVAETVIDWHSGEKKLNRRKDILAILDRANNDTSFFAKLLDNPDEALQGFDLTSEEKAAIAGGDTRQIEAWIYESIPEHRKWLWKRLRQESL